MWRQRCLIAVAVLVVVACARATTETGRASAVAAEATGSVTSSPSDPRTTSRPTYPPLPPVTPPPATVPPARTWSVAGVVVDLPEGWWNAPDAMSLGVIAALDRIGDPPAGVYNLILRAEPGTFAGWFRFYRIAARAEAGLLVRRLDSDILAAEAADAAEEALGDDDVEVARSTISLPLGRAAVLQWTRLYQRGALHVRAIFLQLDGGIVRVDFATPRPPSDAQLEMLRSILESMRH